MSAIDILKLQLDDFFERSYHERHTLFINKEKKYYIKALFELEKHIYDLKRQYNVNQDIDCSISSQNILDSFNKSPDYYRSDNYLLSFLIFLGIQKEHNADNLLEYMDKYFDLVKDKLSFSDIVTTATGATRCYTNVRFALKRLRNFGLIHSTMSLDYNLTRSLLPTPFGYLIAFFVSDLTEEDVKRLLDNNYSKPQDFYNVIHLFKRNTERFINSINSFAKKEDISELIDSIRNSVNDIPSNIKIENGYFTEEVEKTERAMKEYYLNDEKQQEISLRIRELINNR